MLGAPRKSGLANTESPSSRMPPPSESSTGAATLPDGDAGMSPDDPVPGAAEAAGAAATADSMANASAVPARVFFMSGCFLVSSILRLFVVPRSLLVRGDDGVGEDARAVHRQVGGLVVVGDVGVDEGRHQPLALGAAHGDVDVGGFLHVHELRCRRRRGVMLATLEIVLHDADRCRRDLRGIAENIDRAGVV